MARKTLYSRRLWRKIAQLSDNTALQCVFCSGTFIPVSLEHIREYFCVAARHAKVVPEVAFHIAFPKIFETLFIRDHFDISDLKTICKASSRFLDTEVKLLQRSFYREKIWRFAHFFRDPMMLEFLGEVLVKDEDVDQKLRRHVLQILVHHAQNFVPLQIVTQFI